jgi:cytochrome P450
MVEARERRLAALSCVPPDDFLTVLLAAHDDLRTERALSKQEIAANIFTFIVASYETSAAGLAFALYLLAIDSEWRERVEMEADSELPEGRYVEGALPRLMATRAVVEETLRLYPPIPTISRQAIASDRLAEQSIDPGTFVVISPWVLHRHRLLWKMPDLFDPSRFLPGARETIDRFAYLPFGAGPRTCIGGPFAMQEMIITLATIVGRFRLELAAGHKMWPVHRVGLRPEGGLPMILHRRHRN